MQKIGFMGGTFNPIHNGHLLLAEWAKDYLGLDKVLIIPTGVSYLKAGTKILSGEERLKLVNLAIADHPDFESCDIEIRRDGYTYTYETLLELKQIYPGDEFYFICGADCLMFVDQWKNVNEIFQNCVFVAAVRDQASPEELENKRRELLRQFQADIRIMPFMKYSISSTEIRRRIADGKSIRYLVPEQVRKYILDKGLYRG